jgi:exopolysaccharide biosynthesis protein
MNKKFNIQMNEKTRKILLKAGEYTGKVLLCVISFALVIVMTLLSAIYIISKGKSDVVREMFVVAMVETGAMDFCAHMFLSDAEVDAIMAKNQIIVADGETDETLINISGDGEEKPGVIVDGEELKYNEQGVALIDIKGKTYVGKVLIIKDPSRVSVAGLPAYGYDKVGKSTEKMAKEHNALAAINGGGYEEMPGDYTKTGGVPLGANESGVVIIDGKLMWGNKDQKYDFIGFNNDNILIVDRMTAQQALDSGMRDAVNWGPVLVKNGEPSVIPSESVNPGFHPRSAIGQRADGSVILVVVDGRQSHSMGASYDDMVEIMMEYGAVNAANLDGGMSSYMVYENEVITSPYMLYWNGRRNVSTSFIVSRLED